MDFKCVYCGNTAKKKVRFLFKSTVLGNWRQGLESQCQDCHNDFLSKNKNNNSLKIQKVTEI